MTFTTIPGSGSSATTISGSASVDSVTISRASTESIFIGAQKANDTITFDGPIERSKFTIKGGQGGDTITFGGTTLISSFINGNSDADVFGSTADAAKLSASTLKGGQGVDQIFVNSASTSVVNGNKQADTINLAGSLADSKLHGGGGNDTITVGNASLQNSLVKGDKGNDSISLAILASAGRVTTNSTTQGGEGNDTINAVLSTADLLLAGGTGADTIAGGTNTDTLNGGTGADSIQGNNGADVLNGGDGNDNFVYTATADLFATNTLVDVLDGGTGTDAIAINNNGGATFTIAVGDLITSRFSSVESIRAYAASDNIISVTLADSSYEAGLRTVDLSADTDATANNVINVGAETGANGYALTGSAGIDAFTGGAGTDTVSGGGGADTINGGALVDRLTGGAGNDQFRFMRTSTLTTDRDRITDGAAADLYAINTSTGGALAGAFRAAAGAMVDGNGSASAAVADAASRNADVSAAINIAAGAAVDVGNAADDVLIFNAGTATGIDGLAAALAAAGTTIRQSDSNQFANGERMFAVVENTGTNQIDVGTVTFNGAGAISGVTTMFEIDITAALTTTQVATAMDFIGLA